MNSVMLKRLWDTVEKLQAKSLIQLSDHELKQTLLQKVGASLNLNEAHRNQLQQFLENELDQVRDRAWKRGGFYRDGSKDNL